VPPAAVAGAIREALACRAVVMRGWWLCLIPSRGDCVFPVIMNQFCMIRLDPSRTVLPYPLDFTVLLLTRR